jgi:hypothetical protein
MLWITLAMAQSTDKPAEPDPRILLDEPPAERFGPFHAMMTYCTGLSFDIVDINPQPLYPLDAPLASPMRPTILTVEGSTIQFLGSAVEAARPTSSWGELLPSGGAASGLHISRYIAGKRGPSATAGLPEWGWDHGCYVNVPHGDFDLVELMVQEKACLNWMSIGSGREELTGYWIGAPARIRVERALDNVMGFTHRNYYVYCSDRGSSRYPAKCKIRIKNRDDLIEEGRALVHKSMAALGQTANPCQGMAPQP